MITIARNKIYYDNVADGSFIQCCPNGRPISAGDTNAINCAGIKIEAGDPFFKNRACLSVVRSQSAPALDCKPGPTNQVSQSGLIDGG